MGERIGVGAPAMSKLENGKMSWTVERLYQVADALECDPRALLPDGPPVRLGMIISDAERDLLLAARRRDQMETIRLALVLLGVRDA